MGGKRYPQKFFTLIFFLCFLIPFVSCQSDYRWVYENVDGLQCSYIMYMGAENKANFIPDMEDFNQNVSGYGDDTSYSFDSTAIYNRQYYTSHNIEDSGNFTNDFNSMTFFNGSFEEQGNFGIFESEDNLISGGKIYETSSALTVDGDGGLTQWAIGAGSGNHWDLVNDWYDEQTTWLYEYSGSDAEEFTIVDSTLEPSWKLENVTVYLRCRMGSGVIATADVSLKLGGVYGEVYRFTPEYPSSSYSPVVYETISYVYDYSESDYTVSDFDDAIIKLVRISPNTFCLTGIRIVIGASLEDLSGGYDVDTILDYDYSDFVYSILDVDCIGVTSEFSVNISNEVEIYAWNWVTTSFISQVVSSPTSQTTFWFELSTDYLNETFGLRFRIISSNETSFEIDFDEFYIEFEFEALEEYAVTVYEKPEIRLFYAVNVTENYDFSRVFNGTFSGRIKLDNWLNDTYAGGSFFEPVPRENMFFNGLSWNVSSNSSYWQDTYCNFTVQRTGYNIYLTNSYYTGWYNFTYSFDVSDLIVTTPNSQLLAGFGDYVLRLEIGGDGFSECPFFDIEIDFFQMDVSYYVFRPIDYSIKNIGHFVPNFLIGVIVFIIVGSVLAIITRKIVPKKQKQTMFGD